MYLPLKIYDKMNNSDLDALNKIAINRDDAYDRAIMAMTRLLPLEWGKLKKVYCPDEDFVSALIDTEDVTVYPYLLKSLPFDTIYIDLSESSSIYLEGIFVSVDVKQDGAIKLYFITINPEEQVQSSIHVIKRDSLCDNNGYLYRTLSSEECHIEYSKMNPSTGAFEKTHSDDKLTQNVLFFLYQFLLYISTPEADIVENEFSKKIYKPSQIEKTKLSAVQKWDVGVRYGNKYRKRKAIEEEFEYRRDIKSSTKRPHVRCAHWSHYWVGEGRQTIKLKWLEPTFVNGETDDIIASIIPISEREKPGFKGEERVAAQLNKLNINYRAQHYIRENGRRFDFSFTIDGKLHFIEYDGEQHFKIVDCWGGLEGYNNRIAADIEKNDYCQKNRIPLLRIRYDQFNEIPDIISDFVLHSNSYYTKWNPLLSNTMYYSIRE